MVRVGGEKTDCKQIRGRVRLWWVLSPDLFSLYGQRVIEELGDMSEIVIGAKNVNSMKECRQHCHYGLIRRETTRTGGQDKGEL